MPHGLPKKGFQPAVTRTAKIESIVSAVAAGEAVSLLPYSNLDVFRHENVAVIDPQALLNNLTCGNLVRTVNTSCTNQYNDQQLAVHKRTDCTNNRLKHTFFPFPVFVNILTERRGIFKFLHQISVISFRPFLKNPDVIVVNDEPKSNKSGGSIGNISNSAGVMCDWGKH